MANASDFINGLNAVQQTINNAIPLGQSSQDQFQSGFSVPATFSADGNGLPSSKVPTYQDARFSRKIIKWFVPNFGIISMFINPSSISYEHKKLVAKDRTKGGYTLQYWGEELDVLNISGTTGSAGIEGINVLYEIYRAEQYAFDSTGLVIASNNATTDLSNTVTGLAGAIGGNIGGIVGGITSGLLGIASPNSNLSVQNVPTMAQSAFTVEMYYDGLVHRGYFDSMTVNERAENFLIEYQMRFVVTQRRGYRTNYFPWAKSATNGPSSYSSPDSFNGKISF